MNLAFGIASHQPETRKNDGSILEIIVPTLFTFVRHVVFNFDSIYLIPYAPRVSGNQTLSQKLANSFTCFLKQYQLVITF